MDDSLYDRDALARLEEAFRPMREMTVGRALEDAAVTYRQFAEQMGAAFARAVLPAGLPHLTAGLPDLGAEPGLDAMSWQAGDPEL